MRHWEIIEKRHEEDYKSNSKEFDMRDNVEKLDKLVDAIYDCGFEEGYKKAKEESSYGERSSYRSMR